jgi:hypothetical protein
VVFLADGSEDTIRRTSELGPDFCTGVNVSTTVALNWYQGRRFQIFAGNGILEPDTGGDVATATRGSQPPHGGLFSRATAPSGAALRAQLAE